MKVVTYKDAEIIFDGDEKHVCKDVIRRTWENKSEISLKIPIKNHKYRAYYRKNDWYEAKFFTLGNNSGSNWRGSYEGIFRGKPIKDSMENIVVNQKEGKLELTCIWLESTEEFKTKLIAKVVKEMQLDGQLCLK